MERGLGLMVWVRQTDLVDQAASVEQALVQVGLEERVVSGQVVLVGPPGLVELVWAKACKVLELLEALGALEAQVDLVPVWAKECKGIKDCRDSRICKGYKAFRDSKACKGYKDCRGFRGLVVLDKHQIFMGWVEILEHLL
jgi:hypothetical protein